MDAVGAPLPISPRITSPEQRLETPNPGCCEGLARIWSAFVQAIQCAINFFKSCCATRQLEEPALPELPPTIERLKGAKLPKAFETALQEEALNVIGGGKLKSVYKVQNSSWVVKNFKGCLRPLAITATDILFYEASKQLELRVVPKVRYIDPNSESFQAIEAKGCRYPVLVQAYINDRLSVRLSIPHAQEVVLFNWIMGRQDSKRENSAVDENGRVWEIDNDSPLALYSLTDPNREHSWVESALNGAVMTTPLSEEIMGKLLALKKPIDLSHRFMPEDERSLERASKVEKTLNDNLSLLQEIIRSLQEEGALISLNVLNEKIREKAEG